MLAQEVALLSPALAALLVMAVLVLYVYYTTARHYRIKIVLGPALLAMCLLAVPCVGGRLGYGWPAPLPASFEYIAHRTVVSDGEKRWIDVMLLSRNQAHPEPRLHRVPWSRSLEEVLTQAQRMKEGREGGDIVLRRPGRASGHKGTDSGYAAVRILPRDQAPKQAPPTSPAPPVPPPEEPRRKTPVTPDLVV